jgi:nucleotide-binding universal stress UspA family protein
MIEPIIATVDPHREDVAAAALGTVFARLAAAPLVLAAAYPVDLPVDNLNPAPSLADTTDAAVTRVAARIRHGSDVPLSTKAVPSSGSFARALHQLAKRERASLLVVGSSRRGPIGRVFPGAVTDRLLHGAPCPVAVAPAGLSLDDARAPGLIGVAFADTPDGHLALTFARSLARAARARIRIFTVAEPLELLTTGAADAAEAARRAGRQAAEATLARGIAGVPAGHADGGRVLAGNPADALAAASEELDLLVCGSRGRGPLRTLLLGGTSHALVRKASCPVLVVPLGAHLPDLDEPRSARHGASLQEV